MQTYGRLIQISRFGEKKGSEKNSNKAINQIGRTQTIASWVSIARRRETLFLKRSLDAVHSVSPPSTNQPMKLAVRRRGSIFRDSTFLVRPPSSIPQLPEQAEKRRQPNRQTTLFEVLKIVEVFVASAGRLVVFQIFEGN